MRRAKYDMRQVICKKASCIGYSSNKAKPGYWLAFTNVHGTQFGRVLGRIDHAEYDGLQPCNGYLAVIALGMELTHANIQWVNPDDVSACYEKPPAKLFAWITGDEWVKSKSDIARIIAMSQHGNDAHIDNRDDPEQAYNARPAYIKQFILE